MERLIALCVAFLRSKVGGFIGESWKECNGRFRNDVRRFLRVTTQTVRSLAPCFLGSPDIYGCDNTYAPAAIHRRYWRARLATSSRSIMSANRGDTLGLVGFARLMARIWYLMLAM